MVQINWIKQAITDLNNISDYIAKDSPKYADITVDSVFEKTQILKNIQILAELSPK